MRGFHCLAKCFLLVFVMQPLCISRAMAMELPLDVDFARQGAHTLALVSFVIPPEYHAYGHAPGDTGRPTELSFVLEGSGAMPVLYPEGKASQDIYDPAIKTRIYEGRTSLLAILPEHCANGMYAAKLDLLLCSKRHCMPLSNSLAGSIPREIPPLAATTWQNEAARLLADQDKSSGAISMEEGQKPPLAQVVPEANPESSQPQIHGMPLSDAFSLNFSPRYAGLEAEVQSMASALLLGLLAGLLLNAMPCVLPVLTLKVSGLLLLGRGRKQVREFRRHSCWFAAGIMTFFTILALLLGLADLMWGQLYQNEAILLLMLLLVFLMGLSMLGVFTLPMLDLKLDARAKSPAIKAYLTGVISTFLATPCSGPLLGGVLAWAFIQPLPVLMAVFWSVGIGMSLPYVVFSIWPRLAHFLPRPGVWMHAFERALGFLLLATALYLLSILPADKHMRILCVLLAGGATAWAWGAFCGLSAPHWRRIVVAICSLGLAVAGVMWVMAPPAARLQWQTFSAESFSRQLGNKPMLVEFTADWCPNCKFLEATVLESGELRSLKDRYDLELVKVDITRPNEAAERLLHSLGSKSIPVTALFPPGADARSPVILRDLYSMDALRRAAKEAFGAR